jgi:FSR family fosmidomycin resistance protein-like MFS transporter
MAATWAGFVISGEANSNMYKNVILLMFLGHVWVDTTQGVLPIVLTQFKDIFNLSYLQVGVLMMVLNLTSSVIQPIFGYISDRYNLGWFIPAGVLWTSITLGILGWAPNYPVAIILVALSGLGTAAFHPRAMMAVFLASGSRRGLGTAIFSTGGNIGFALGPLVASVIVLGFGLAYTPVLIVPGTLLFLAILMYSPRIPQAQPRPAGSTTAEPLPGLNTLPWVALIAVFLIITFRSWVYISFITYLPMLLENRGVPLPTGGVLLTVFLVGGALAGLYGGHLSDRFGRLRVIFFSMIIYPILAGFMLVSEGLWLWILTGLSGAALLASFSVTIVLTQELMPGRLGLASGLALGLGFGTGGLGSALTGFLADTFSLYTAAWVLAIAPAAAAFLVLPVRPALRRMRESG